MLKAHHFLSIQMEASTVQIQNQQTVATAGKRVNVPWFSSQGSVSPNSVKYLCTQYLAIQWAACSPKS